MKRGRVAPVLLLVVAAAALLAAGAFFFLRPAPRCCPLSAPPPLGNSVTVAPATAEAPGPALAARTPTPGPAAASSAISTSAIAVVAATQDAAAEQRMAELAAAMSESYGRLGELRRAIQDSPEVRQLQADGEEARRALGELTQSDPAIRTLTERRKALMDEMTALQATQTDLARAARAQPTNTAARAEVQAALAKIRETSAEIGTVARSLEAARQEFAARNPAVAELTARVSDTQEKLRKAINGNPEIQALDQRIQAMAAESRQIGQRRQRLGGGPAPAVRAPAEAVDGERPETPVVP